MKLSIHKVFLGALCSMFMGFSSLAQQSAEQKIQAFINQNVSSEAREQGFGWTIDRSTSDKKRGLDHFYVLQSYQGFPLLNGTAVFVQKGQDLRMTGNRLIAKAEVLVNTGNQLSPEACLLSVFSQMLENDKASEWHSKKVKKGEYLLSASNQENIPMKEGYFYVGGVLRKVYDLSYETKKGPHWWNIYADAYTGEILHITDWIVSCSFEACNVKNASELHQHANAQHQMMMAPAPPPQNDAYRVIAIPAESPIHNVPTLVTGPFDVLASPFGWHDTNGNPGEEYTITRGNNVWAAEDKDDDNVQGYSPDGGANLVFDFPIITTDSAEGYLDAAITNLFYMNNIMHDVWYQYGFDEQSGNFQQNNYGNGGSANDYVVAQAQDGSGMNNANFGTPPDGSTPRMQMYIWTASGSPRLFYVNSPAEFEGRYGSGKANFGPSVFNMPITGDLAIAYDSVGGDILDGCTQILNPADVAGKIALVRRGGGCDFATKVLNCQAAGAIAVVVVNNSLGAPGNMNATPTSTVNIPSIQIGLSPGANIISHLQGGGTMNVDLYDDGWSGNTDSDFDNGIIAHEYGHGISNRLTGGPAASGCLYNEDQMGEGWSDWVGLMLTIEAGDQGSDVRGIGAYVQNEDRDGEGIRPSPYSTNTQVNGATYGITNNASISRPHGIGFVWATMLWDLTWNFVEVYGLDLDVYNGTGGNNKVMELVIEGMKLQPCGPGMVDGRDAILMADELLNNGVNECLIWKTFAKRGLGENADQGDANDRFDQIEDFTVPFACIAGLSESEIAALVQIQPNPATDQVQVVSVESNPILSVRIFDMNGRLMQELQKLSTASLSLDVSGYQPGVYLVELQLANGHTVKRMVKQ